MCLLLIGVLLLSSCEVLANRSGSGENDENKEPYAVQFRSNGDGTCAVDHVTFNPDYEGNITLIIPETSPQGERVTAVDAKFCPVIPLWVLKEDFEADVITPLQKALDKGTVSDFEQRKLLSFYTPFDLNNPEIMQPERDYLEATYPFLTIVYVTPVGRPSMVFSCPPLNVTVATPLVNATLL